MSRMILIKRPTFQDRLVQYQLQGERFAKMADAKGLDQKRRNELADAAMHWMTKLPPKDGRDDVFLQVYGVR